MKKLLFIVVVSVLCFSSCKKGGGNEEKKNEISLDVNHKELYKDSEFQIPATSNRHITYICENEFHAKVSETGLVTAGYVGQTNILLDNGEDRKNFTLTVVPKYYLYPEPELNFGMSKSDFIAKHGKPDKENGKYISYNNYSVAATQVVYVFEENRLQMAAVFVGILYTSALTEFLLERYQPISYSDDYFFFINTLTENKTTMGVMLKVDIPLLVGYAPYSSSKSTDNQFSELKKLSQELKH
jgi:hypothetical protein